MTFQSFESAIRTYRPDIKEVCPHNNKVEVIFHGTDKIYRYSGSYSQILANFGVPVIGKAEVKEIENRLAREREALEESDAYGFGEDPEVDEMTRQEIERLEGLLNKYKNYVIA